MNKIVSIFKSLNKQKYSWVKGIQLLLIFVRLGITLGITSFAYAAVLDDLSPNERNTVEVFQNFSPKVVYVHRLATVVNHFYERMQVPAGAGSGIIWDAEGHIVTNFHVIDGADNIAVTIGTLTVPAKLIGAEPRKDLAVLSIQSSKALSLLKAFIPFELTHTSGLLVGQKTIAIGNPYGLDHTLTVGVISALGRQVLGPGGVTIRDMIQTDASINPGNSGGPLLDHKGRLIGLNTAIYSNTGSSAGIGFAVPADDVQRIASQIIKNGRIVLSGIGVQVIEPHVAHRLGIKTGLLVGSVLPNTPAQQVGIQGSFRRNGVLHLGDIIIGLNGHPIKDYDIFYNLLEKIKVGETISLAVLRGGKEIKFKMRTIDIAGYA